jgi:GTP 3',8-cyclase
VRTRPPIVDGFGRTIGDLRISVTDRCNFRCAYCMPPEGLPWTPDGDLLDFEEITRIASIFVACGVTSIKLTGGEPLVRHHLERLVGALRQLDETLDISLTTNGYLLAGAAGGLRAAGLDRVTVSCDSLLRHRFAELTLRDALAKVRRGLQVAAEVGLTPIKVNVVVMRGRNDDEAVAFARLARETGYEIRFIEYMPLDAQGAWTPEDVVPGAALVREIGQVFPLVEADAGRAPSTRYLFADGAPGSIGLIPSVTEPFCASCDRIRLTADGQLRPCLFSNEETDLRTPLREGAAEQELEHLVRACVADKWAGHRVGRSDFVRPKRSMSMIGG